MHSPLALASALLLAGCACLCDIDGAIGSRAGEGASDCGLVPLGADRSPALDCAAAAIAAGRGFRVGWHDRGRDSEVRRYVAGHDGSFSMFGYDGDPSGGSHACPTLTETPCADAPVRTTDASGMPVISCTATTSRTVCSD